MTTIKEDIELAKMWAAPAKLIDLPGEGEGWRHTCYRLAMEVERLTECLDDQQYEMMERDEKSDL